MRNERTLVHLIEMGEVNESVGGPTMRHAVRMRRFTGSVNVIVHQLAAELSTVALAAEDDSRNGECSDVFPSVAFGQFDDV